MASKTGVQGVKKLEVLTVTPERTLAQAREEARQWRDAVATPPRHSRKTPLDMLGAATHHAQAKTIHAEISPTLDEQGNPDKVAEAELLNGESW